MSGPIGKPAGSGLIRRSGGFCIQPLGPSPLGGDIHEGFKVDKNGNIKEGHTTIRIKGGKAIHLPWK